MRAAMRAERCWAASRSACSEARVTRGPDAGFVWWLGFGGVDLFEQVAVAVEEGAVDPGAASDAGDAEFRTVCDGVVERGEDALAAAGGVGPTSVDHRVDGGSVGGHGVLSGRRSGRVWRVRGMPSMVLRWRRTTVTAC